MFLFVGNFNSVASDRKDAFFLKIRNNGRKDQNTPSVKTCIKILFTDMYKNIVPLPEVSADPSVGPQINTRSEIGVGVGVWVGEYVRGVWVYLSLRVLGPLGSSLGP